MEQVLAGDPGLVACFRLSGVLQFYASTIGGLAGETAALPALVADMRATTLKVVIIHTRRLLAFMRHCGPTC